VDAYTQLPLRQLVTDLTERFQLKFAQQAAVLLDGFSGVQAVQSASGILLRAVAERDLQAAVTLLQAAFPAIRSGPVEIVLRSDGSMEPFARLRVRSPTDAYAAVVDQLTERGATIESVEDAPDGIKIMTAAAPLARLQGYDRLLARTTRGRGAVDYAFADYRPVQPAPAGRPGSPTTET
jgi:translation elongation factor EF-G